MVKQGHCYGSVCVMPSSEQKLPYGTEREALLREESQLETASNVSERVCRPDCRCRSRAAVFGWRPLVCARTDSELGVSPTVALGTPYRSALPAGRNAPNLGAIAHKLELRNRRNAYVRRVVAACIPLGVS